MFKLKLLLLLLFTDDVLLASSSVLRSNDDDALSSFFLDWRLIDSSLVLSVVAPSPNTDTDIWLIFVLRKKFAIVFEEEVDVLVDLALLLEGNGGDVLGFRDDCAFGAGSSSLPWLLLLYSSESKSSSSLVVVSPNILDFFLPLGADIE